jgi:hypothetical protein
MTYREVPDSLEEAKKEIARLQEMLTKARVVRVEVDEPGLVDGKWMMYPVITCIGCDEKEFAETAGMILASCYVETHRRAQQERGAEKAEGEQHE